MGPCYCSTSVRIMWVKINFTWIWAVIIDLGLYKVNPRDKNAILVQISSTKKTLLAIFQIFKILQMSSYSEQTPYWEIFIFDKPSSLTFLRFRELSGFVTFPGFVHAKNLLYTIFKYCKFCTVNITSHNLLCG